MHHAGRLDALLHERQQALARRIPILFKRIRPMPLFLLSGHCDQCFVFQVSAPPALVESAPVAFVDFHCPGQQIRSRPTIARRILCSHVQAVSYLLRPNTLCSPKALAPLLGGDPPHRTKPHRQRAALPERWSPRPEVWPHTQRTAAALFAFHNRNPDSGNRPASAAGTDTPGRSPHC